MLNDNLLIDENTIEISSKYLIYFHQYIAINRIIVIVKLQSDAITIVPTIAQPQHYGQL